MEGKGELKKRRKKGKEREKKGMKGKGNGKLDAWTGWDRKE